MLDKSERVCYYHCMHELNGIVRCVGDIHGKPHLIPKDEDWADHLILMGDIGLGFKPNTDDEELNEIVEEGRTQEVLERIRDNAVAAAGGNENVQIWLVRGNHDNPAYWSLVTETAKNVFQKANTKNNLHLLQDEFVLINGKKWLTFGGGVSVDQAIRKDGYDYWHDEEIDTFDKFSAEEIEGILSHVGVMPPKVRATPNNFIQKIIEKSGLKLHAAIDREKTILESLYGKFKPKRWIYAHWHVEEIFSENGCAHVVLDAEFTPRYDGLKLPKPAQSIDIQ